MKDMKKLIKSNLCLTRFSLVELLVVMAIFAILLGLLMPALRSSLGTARSIACAKNLQGIGGTTSQYIPDYDGRYPVAACVTGISWDDLLSRYDGRNLTNAQMIEGGEWGPAVNQLPNGSEHGPHYRCPSDLRANPIRWGTTTTEGVKKSYSPTQAEIFPNGNVDRSILGIIGIIRINQNVNPPFSRYESSLSKAGTTIIFTENHLDYTGDSYCGPGSTLGSSARLGNVRASWLPNPANPVHGIGGYLYNFLMADGHVANMLLQETLVKDDGTMATTPDVRGSMWDATR